MNLIWSSNRNILMLAKSGGRALASFINKYNVNENFNYDIFAHFNINYIQNAWEIRSSNF